MTDTNREKLLPCPFCEIHVVETGRGYAVHHRSGCFIGAKGSTYFLPHEAKAWNTRQAATQACADEVREDIRILYWMLALLPCENKTRPIYEFASSLLKKLGIDCGTPVAARKALRDGGKNHAE